MPETDVNKMKVAELKRELKLRGLALTGNKTELQDRLQTALLDGEISLEDTAISGEELLDEDAVLTDEDDAKILGADENELLKSPTTISPSLKVGLTSITDDDILDSPTTPTAASKKIVLKRKNSLITSSSSITPIETATTAKENTEPSPAKAVKMSERNPITIGDMGGESNKKDTTAVASDESNGKPKVAQLSLQERLDLRAKKFGISASTAAADSSATATMGGNPNSGVNDEKQIEMLKKRAERFGCVVSSKIAKLDAEEKLLKRKQRFGGGATEAVAADSTAALSTSTATGKTDDVWAEKARARLERFKIEPKTVVAAAAVDAPLAAANASATTTEN